MHLEEPDTLVTYNVAALSQWILAAMKGILRANDLEAGILF